MTMHEEHDGQIALRQSNVRFWGAVFLRLLLVLTLFAVIAVVAENYGSLLLKAALLGGTFWPAYITAVGTLLVGLALACIVSSHLVRILLLVGTSLLYSLMFGNLQEHFSIERDIFGFFYMPEHWTFVQNTVHFAASALVVFANVSLALLAIYALFLLVQWLMTSPVDNDRY